MALRRGDRGAPVFDLQRRLEALGYPPGPIDGIFGPRTEAAVRAFQRDAGMVPDGIVGPRTRRALARARGGAAAGRGGGDPAARPVRRERGAPPGEPRWMAIARREICTREARAGQPPNARIVEYHQSTSLRATSDRTPWCAAFVSWVLEQAGIRSTRSARAKSYLDWGHALDAPRVGAVAVFHRGPGAPTARGPGHVGFLVEERENAVLLLGGNQSNHVNIKSYAKSRLMAYRWPATSP